MQQVRQGRKEGLLVKSCASRQVKGNVRRGGGVRGLNGGVSSHGRGYSFEVNLCSHPDELPM